MKNILEKPVVRSQAMGRASEAALTEFVQAASSISLADLLLAGLNAETNARFDVRVATERLILAINDLVEAKVTAALADIHRERRLSQAADSAKLITLRGKQ